MPADERLQRSVERLSEEIARRFDAALHPHGALGRWASKGLPKPNPKGRGGRALAARHAERRVARADVGITPFRPEDEVAGFYESAKFKRFCGDMRRLAREHGVKVDHVDRAAGVWEGETEPSLAVEAHDHEKGMAAWAADLGKRYNQDGVLLFQPSPDGDSATYSLDLAGRRNEEVLGAMKRHGIPGGRLRGGRLEVIGTGHAFHAKVEALAAELGARYDATVGTMNLLEREGYDAAIRGEAGKPR